MELLDLADDFDPRDATTLVVALDGWTDAGGGGSQAADHLREEVATTWAGAIDGDRVFDFRDRRPTLTIDRGDLGEVQWPSLDLYRLDPVGGPSLLLLQGAEPDFRWPTIGDDVAVLCGELGLTDYVGLGSVPGPVPHTRPVRIITTSSDPMLLERYGRPHERVVVPASFQVTLESLLRDAGLRTLGLWARVPHYVAGEYPAAAAGLLRRLGEHLGTAFDTVDLDEDAGDHRVRLDEAAEGSTEVTAHIAALEEAYDSDVPEDDDGFSGPLPTGDQIAAELERFLRNRE